VLNLGEEEEEGGGNVALRSRRRRRGGGGEVGRGGEWKKGRRREEEEEGRRGVEGERRRGPRNFTPAKSHRACFRERSFFFFSLHPDFLCSLNVPSHLLSQ
jgi:hypothetical protein